MGKSRLETLSNLIGLWRSLLIYYGQPYRMRRLEQFYRPFIKPGDLCFDIGAHVGNRLQAWRRLDARIVAVEPQPEMMRFLQRIYGNDRQIILRPEAVGAEEGLATMYLSRRTPTVSTLSQEWIAAVKKERSFARVQWDSQVQVKVTTLDRLIDEFGCPTFCKIDVEGYELEVLRGLRHAIPGISFEIIPATVDLAHQCVEHLAGIGSYAFNYTPGESHHYVLPKWGLAGEIHGLIDKIGEGQTSGDVFAILAE